MEPYTPGAEFFEDGVLYTARFPVPTIEEVDAELAEYAKDSPEIQAFLNKPPEDTTKFLKELEERYSYKRRSEAVEGAKKYVDLAIALSKQFEIDMEIKRLERSINVKMDIMLHASYSGSVKQYIDALLHISSEYSVLPKDTEYVTFSVDYALYDCYDNKTGEKVDWR